MTAPSRSPVLPLPRELWVDTFEAGGETFAIIELPGIPGQHRLSLTRAEREILDLLLAGRSNAEIARQRGRSVRTVAHQVGTIFGRLGVGSRLELFALCSRSGAAKAEKR